MKKQPKNGDVNMVFMGGSVFPDIWQFYCGGEWIGNSPTEEQAREAYDRFIFADDKRIPLGTVQFRGPSETSMNGWFYRIENGWMGSYADEKEANKKAQAYLEAKKIKEKNEELLVKATRPIGKIFEPTLELRWACVQDDLGGGYLAARPPVLQQKWIEFVFPSAYSVGYGIVNREEEWRTIPSVIINNTPVPYFGAKDK